MGIKMKTGKTITNHYTFKSNHLEECLTLLGEGDMMFGLARRGSRNFPAGWDSSTHMEMLPKVFQELKDNSDTHYLKFWKLNQELNLIEDGIYGYVNHKRYYKE